MVSFGVITVTVISFTPVFMRNIHIGGQQMMNVSICSGDIFCNTEVIPGKHVVLCNILYVVFLIEHTGTSVNIIYLAIFASSGSCAYNNSSAKFKQNILTFPFEINV
jgi:hypothetical protein